MQIQAIIVDDSRIEREMIMETMDWRKLNIWICGTAQNGRQGLKLFEEQKPDLIIADIQMPGMDGIEMVSQIREMDKEVFVVFLSSYESFEYAKAGYSLGVKNYILKQDIGTEKTEQFFWQLQEEIVKRKNRKNNEENGWDSVDKVKHSVPVKTAIEYMKLHLNDKQLDMQQIAKEAALSPSRFRAVFKAETGSSPSQYLSELRFRRAEQLLLETCMKMDDIADEVGFLNGKYFRKVFGQKYNMTPREFRERRGKQDG